MAYAELILLAAPCPESYLPILTKVLMGAFVFTNDVRCIAAKNPSDQPCRKALPTLPHPRCWISMIGRLITLVVVGFARAHQVGRSKVKGGESALKS
jgi:hypothetical protein